MGEGNALRVLTVTVNEERPPIQDDAGRFLDSELTQHGFRVVRHVVLRGAPKFIQQLVRTVGSENEAEAVIVLGGTGISPGEEVLEALEAIFEKKIDGFGEAFRRLLWEKAGPQAVLARATAGVVIKCVVFALPAEMDAVRIGVSDLIVPTLRSAVALALG